MRSDKVCLPRGYRASGLNCGIKQNGRPDLGLIFSEVPALTVAAFTSNEIQAAPVLLCKKHLKRDDYTQAVVVNSGNANCFTGPSGTKDALRMAELAASGLKIKTGSVLVASTGIIGKKLPMERISCGVPALIKKISYFGLTDFSRSIMTTDTVVKQFSSSVNIGGRKVRVSICAKGVGMIAPDLRLHATMLVFCFSDANIDKNALKKAVSYSIGRSFNSITIDGCMSTNDTAIFMANGLAGNRQIKAAGGDYAAFLKVLDGLCVRCAQAIVRDAEGATKFITVKVSGARSDDEARKAAMKIANSNLLKCAIFGENPNFGRVVAAAGSCGIKLNEKRIKVKLSPLNKSDVMVRIDLGSGRGESVVWTSDLSYGYVKINAEYN